MKQLYNISDELQEKRAEFISIQNYIDTTRSTGRAMFGMLGVFAELERDFIWKRIQTGMEAARQRWRNS